MTTRLHECCKAGDVKAAHELIKKGSHDINVEDMYGRTPLGCACYFGHRDMVKFLVVNGACLHTGNTGVTPIHRAICRNRIDIVKLLVAGGCNLKAKTNEKETPLDWAKKFDRKDILAFLEDIEAHHEHLKDLREELGITEIVDNFPSSDEESKDVEDMLDEFED